MGIFTLNGNQTSYRGNHNLSLLQFLRSEKNITSAKDGCSGEGSCGACTVEVNGKPRLACRTKMESLDGASVVTTEGLPESFRRLIGRMFAEKGAVQCGFCSPGFIMRAKQLFETAKNSHAIPSRKDIAKAIHPNICRCTGYVKIIDAIEAALERMSGDGSLWQDEPKHADADNAISPDFKKSRLIEPSHTKARIGSRYPKYQAYETALGERLFVDDMHVEGMLHGVLKFSDHPRARVCSIDTSVAEKHPGVIKVFTAADIPGERYTGLIFQDWPLMLGEDEITRYIGDVLAGVVATSAACARDAVALIHIEYDILPAVTDVHEALEPDSIQVHKNQSNVLETCRIRFGEVDQAFWQSPYVSSGIYETQRIEHAFLETETAIAMPQGDGVLLYSQGQGVYVDRRQVAAILNLPEEKVRVVQVQNGGGFGGKEDLTVQGHAALFAWALKRPVKVRLSRDESIRMHPKRHPVWMEIALAADTNGQFTAVRLKAIGDTGAYASVGTKVMERVVGHATGAYVIPAVDIEAHTVYTNNIPSGAMRGFGVPQVTFAIESCIDDICRQGGFDRWQIRYNNALVDGATTATGQKLEGVGLRKTLLAVKDVFHSGKYVGIACGIKNTGVGNGMIDDSEVIIEIISDKKVIIHHGWTEMGQGVHTMAVQTLHQETGIDPSIIDVVVDTRAGVPTGMTTSSRATALVGKAIMVAAQSLKKDIKRVPPGSENALKQLSGRSYKGKFVIDWTSKPGVDLENPRIHFSYGYATQVVILNDRGRIQKIVAAHDAGKIMNQMLFEGQIEGAIHMGLGYALSEQLPLKDGRLISSRFKDLGILRAADMPNIEVIGIEEKDPYGPYGAKGIGEIGMVPTAAAIANALTIYDNNRRYILPITKNKTY